MGLTRNMIVVALRMFAKDRTYSMTNLLGLAIGIAGSILILLWVKYKYSFDHFAANYEHVYKVKVNTTFNGTINSDDANCVPVYLALRSADARIKNTCITTTTYGHVINFGGTIHNKEVVGVSTEFLEIFGIPLLKGSVRSLDEPNSIMLSESTARDIFGDAEPMDQLVKFDNSLTLKVTGVFRDVPKNSTFWFHALTSMAVLENSSDWLTRNGDKWDNFYWQVYAELPDGAQAGDVERNISNIIKPHFDDGSNPELFLQRMDRWYLYDKFENGRESGGKIDYIIFFSWIAALTLLIAIINYTNLATAKSERRTKEVGIRKSLGSGRQDIVVQFMIESILLTCVAFVVALILVYMAMPYYRLLLGEQLSIDFSAWQLWGAGLALMVLCGTLAGAWPAFYFSSFQPARVLKGQFSGGKSSGVARHVLVTFQYVFSISLIIAVIVINQQIQHVKERALGYDQHNLICVANSDGIRKNYRAIKNELLRSGAADGVTKSNEGIDVDYFTDFVSWRGGTNSKTAFSRVSVDPDYVQTNRMTILQGRDFISGTPADSMNVLVNHKAVAVMGLKDPIGEVIKVRNRNYKIIGVTEDVVRGAPYDPVAPMFMGLFNDNDNHVTIRLSESGDLAANLQTVERIFKKLDPENIDAIEFVQERFRDNYRSIELIGNLADLFSVLAVALTGLGVFALAAFTAERRTKELAIRKVMGATGSNLIAIVAGSFIKTATLAVLISAPLSWWALEHYLNNYSYRVLIPWWTIPISAVAILVFTLLIVVSQVTSAARKNPAHVLKVE